MLFALPPQRLKRVTLCLVIAGSILRMVWPADMEWKSDEQRMYQMGRACLADGLPAVGIPSSKGIANPGLSVWILCGFSKFSETPVDMVRWVQGINILSLWAFYLLALVAIPEIARSTYLMGIGLFAVSPLPILYSRKIWQQCLLSPFSFLFFLGFLFRKKWWGAFVLGFAGLALVQVHLAAGYFLVGVLSLVYLRDWWKRHLRWITLLPLFTGFAVSAIGLIPWARVVMQEGQQGGFASYPLWVSFLKLSFLWSWLADASGAHLFYQMQHLFVPQFAPLPRLFGVPTYLLGVVEVAVILTAIWAFLSTLFRKDSRRQLFHFFADDDVHFYTKAIFVGYGFILTAACVGVFPHYLLVCYPFIHISWAMVLKNRVKLWWFFVVTSFLLSTSFLVYAHTFPGQVGGEFGTTYRYQLDSR